MGIGNRVRGLLSVKGVDKTLHNETDITYDTWRNVKYDRQKVNEKHIDAVCEVFPKYRLWVQTGGTDEQVGQMAPAVKKAPGDGH